MMSNTSSLDTFSRSSLSVQHGIHSPVLSILEPSMDLSVRLILPSTMLEVWGLIDTPSFNCVFLSS